MRSLDLIRFNWFILTRIGYVFLQCRINQEAFLNRDLTENTLMNCKFGVRESYETSYGNGVILWRYSPQSAGSGTLVNSVFILLNHPDLINRDDPGLMGWA